MLFPSAAEATGATGSTAFVWSTESMLLHIPIFATGLCEAGHARVLEPQDLRPRQDQIGGTVARPYRSLDGCRQPRISPVAGEKQVFARCHRAGPQRILLR